MSNRNRLYGPNGDPLPPSQKPPESVSEMIAKAKKLWRDGDKQQAFDQLCETNFMLSKGVARLFLDLAEVVKQLKELNQKVTPK